MTPKRLFALFLLQRCCLLLRLIDLGLRRTRDLFSLICCLGQTRHFFLMLLVRSPYHMLATAGIHTDVGATGKAGLFQMRIAWLKKRSWGLVKTHSAAWQDDRASKDLGEETAPWKLFLWVEVLAEALQVHIPVGHMHLNSLLWVVNEEVMGCRALQFVCLSVRVDLRTELAGGERIVVKHLECMKHIHSFHHIVVQSTLTFLTVLVLLL